MTSSDPITTDPRPTVQHTGPSPGITPPHGGFDSIGKHLDAAFDHLLGILSNEAGTLAIPTGFPEFDKFTGGLRPGQLTVIAARPGLGKSSLMRSMVAHLALNEKRHGLVLTGEQTAAMWILGTMLSRALVPKCCLDGPPFHFTKGDLERIQRAGSEIKTSKLAVENARGLQPSMLDGKLRRLMDESRVDFLAIDHLDLIEPGPCHPVRPRQQVAGALKQMAMEHGIAVIALASLKPSAGNRDIPLTSDLRGASAIETEADVIAMIHPGRQPEPTTQACDECKNDEVCLELSIVKNRNGATGTLPLLHYPSIDLIVPAMTGEQEQSDA